MAKNSKRTKPSSQLGCGFMLLNGLILIAMLVANVWFVKAFFSLNFSGMDDRVFQAAQFVLPIIMIFIQYWIYDAVFTVGKLPSKNSDTKARK